MDEQLVIRGRYTGRMFIPDEPLPEIEGTAELRVTPAAPKPAKSIFECFGKAPVLRSRQDIEAQLREERESWGDR